MSQFLAFYDGTMTINLMKIKKVNLKKYYHLKKTMSYYLKQKVGAK